MLFNKPTNLNGAELKAELLAVGIEIERLTIEADGKISMEIKSGDSSKAEAIINAHDGTIIPQEPTIADKLASVGLSIDELKAALLG